MLHARPIRASCRPYADKSLPRLGLTACTTATECVGVETTDETYVCNCCTGRTYQVNGTPIIGANAELAEPAAHSTPDRLRVRRESEVGMHRPTNISMQTGFVKHECTNLSDLCYHTGGAVTRKYTNEERARKGGYARAKKLGKRQLSEDNRRAAIIRWARVKGLLAWPHAPATPFQKPAA